MLILLGIALYCMSDYASYIIDSIHVIGFNHKMANVSVRSKLVLNEKKCEFIYANAHSYDIENIVTLNTCNRTEIYAISYSVQNLRNLFLATCDDSSENLDNYIYTKSGIEAIFHLNKVANGLDSQILGDFEILRQCRDAVKFADKKIKLNAIFRKLFDVVFKNAKNIKTKTLISSGSVSVTNACLQYISKLNLTKNDKILVVGLGKFGNHLINQLSNSFNPKNISISNRTIQKTKCLKKEFTIIPFENLHKHLADYTVVIACTNSPELIISKKHIIGAHTQYFIDLSVPINIDENIKNIANKYVINVDELSSKFIDETIAIRQSQVPQSLALINESIEEFKLWLYSFETTRKIKKWKENLSLIDKYLPAGSEKGNICSFQDDRKQKAIKDLVLELKDNKNKGCIFISALVNYVIDINNKHYA